MHFAIINSKDSAPAYSEVMFRVLFKDIISMVLYTKYNILPISLAPRAHDTRTHVLLQLPLLPVILQVVFAVSMYFRNYLAYY